MRKKTLWLLGISLLFGSTGICIGNLVFYAGNLCITVICNSGTKIVKTYVIRACTLGAYSLPELLRNLQEENIFPYRFRRKIE